MALQPEPVERSVGVRELHDHLSRYVQEVQDGMRVVVTMHGRPVARLVAVDQADPLADLRARGLLREPAVPRSKRTGARRLTASTPVSELVAEQRR